MGSGLPVVGLKRFIGLVSVEEEKVRREVERAFGGLLLCGDDNLIKEDLLSMLCCEY